MDVILSFCLPCYVKFSPMWMSLVYRLLSFFILITCYVKFCFPLCECHLVFPLLSFVILITCYVKFAPMWMSSCLLLSRLTLVTLSFSYVNVILFSLCCFLSYLSFVMLSLLLCECHLVFPLLSFVILITCYVKFALMWMSSCLPSIVFCHA